MFDRFVSSTALVISRMAGFTVVALLIFQSVSFAEFKRLDENAFPTFQSINLKLDPALAEYSGSVSIQFDIKKATNTFSFNADGLTLGKMKLKGPDGYVGFGSKVNEVDTSVIDVTTDDEIQPGSYTLDIDFTNDFNTQATSLYKLKVDERSYSFTQFESIDAREAFPCWDEPIFKIPFQMTLTVPENHETVSNTPFLSEKITDGWKTVVFEKTKPIPSYLLAIATGELEFVDIPGMSIPGRIVTVKGKTEMTQEALSATPKILAALEEYFGRPYPYKKLDLLAVPEFWAGAMENVGAVTFRETILLVDPKEATVSQKRRLASVMSHELAHMWFGDLVTMEWWDDLWLNESFASWMGNKITHEVFPEYQMDISTARRASRVMSSDARPSAEAIRKPISDPGDLTGNVGVIYVKGEATLNMFERWVGEEAFRKGVLDYLATHEWGNATADDLWSALSAASGKDVTSAMGTFIEKPGVPQVTVETALDGSVTLTQSRFANYGVTQPETPIWTIPVELRYADESGVRSKTATLSEPSVTIKLESDGDIKWILPNPGVSGYYRWTTSAAGLNAIASASGSLEPGEKIGYLGNLSALMDAGVVSGGDYLKALSNFAGDKDANVISAVIAGLGKVQGAFVPDELSNQYAIYVRNTLSPALEQFGLEPKDGEEEAITRVRPQLMGMMVVSGHDEPTQKHCEEIARKYLADPQSVDASTIGIAIQVSALRGHRDMFDEYRKRFEAAEKPAERSRFLSALGQFRDPKLRDEALLYAFDGPLRPQELFTIPGGVASESDASQEYIFTWLQKNYETITAKMPPMFKTFLPYFAGGCSGELLEEANQFFMDSTRYVKGVERQLGRISDQVNDCVGLREREGPAVAAYLRSLSVETN
jgi:aminopeptidase N